MAASEAVPPSGVITITTDFGHQGPFVGVIKGCILARFPEARLIDLTHEIVVHWPAEAGFWLARAFGYFPRGTVHVAVVDPGVGTARNIVAVSAGGHYFLAPDNGLLAPVVTRARDPLIVRLGAGPLARLGIHHPSATFHGRDIFAPVAAALAAGHCRIESLGEVITTIVPSWVEDPTVETRSVSGIVITIDHFGNLITNIDAPLLERFRLPLVHAGNHAFPILRTYGDTRPGEYLALINSFGVLEIARAENSAAEGLGLSRGAPVVVRDRTDQP
ncbi:MAG: SAM-dependent chlorinase/fluorinase [Gammaproteobacteria bacterium]|nr:SAM-dependent chlorinase/fluorinase [Gammaproteobacteria bacterium]MBV8973863.1 SAM-dependent chlorinase/fluorinase [Nevskiaceae bacterium]MBV9318065.1 SAM-dependent chlorinase/fluorinase [Gammaproteobacteria bacterium]MBV9724816.1 SAM-dependent chlorinase/fluorinase [Gammaproteobacteria bacterium]